MKSRPANRRGYVLVMTLGLLALAAISLATLARYSLETTIASQEAAEELQRRWGVLSVRRVISERAAEIIALQVPVKETSTPPWPKPAAVEAVFKLGELKFSVLVADEDAKLNLNAVRANKPDQLATVIRRASFAGAALPLCPIPGTSVLPKIRSWGQVFEVAKASAEPTAAVRLMTVGRHLTCWGSGRLNLCRATDTALREAAGLILPAHQVGELLERRKTWSGQNLDELLSQLELRAPQLAAAHRLFETESQSYSLWITVENGHRNWAYQYLDDGGQVCFTW